MIRENESLERRLGLSASTVASQANAPTNRAQGGGSLTGSHISHGAPNSLPSATADRLRDQGLGAGRVRQQSPEPRGLSTEELVAASSEPAGTEAMASRYHPYSATAPVTSSLLPGYRPPDLRNTAPAGFVGASSLASDVCELN